MSMILVLLVLAAPVPAARPRMPFVVSAISEGEWYVGNVAEQKWTIRFMADGTHEGFVGGVDYHGSWSWDMRTRTLCMTRRRQGGIYTGVERIRFDPSGTGVTADGVVVRIR